MKEGSVLEQTRRVSLWVALGSAATALIIGLLAIWNAVQLVDTPDLDDAFGGAMMEELLGEDGFDLDALLGEDGAALEDLLGEHSEDFDGMMGDVDGMMSDLLGSSAFGFGAPEVTAWGQLMMTAGALLAAASVTLLSLLVASHVRK